MHRFNVERLSDSRNVSTLIPRDINFQVARYKHTELSLSLYVVAQKVSGALPSWISSSFLIPTRLRINDNEEHNRNDDNDKSSVIQIDATS